jgi:2-polyprenyl-6-methoxyphenol hydroxylase-like FAD-dependent oxidoreductase
VVGVAHVQAAVVGGSIGGLCAAIALRDVGCRATVYEQAPAGQQGRGAGIVLHQDLASFLARHEIAAPEDLAVPSTRRIVLDRAGDVVSTDDTRQWMTSYDALVGGLRSALDGVAYRTGTRITDVCDDGRTLEVEDGEPVTADLLIAADGAGSTLRGRLAPEVSPAYAGYVAWRGLCGEADLPGRVADTLAGAFAFFTDPEPAPFPTQILSYLVPGPGGELEPGRRSLNWVWYQPVADLAAHLTDGAGHVHEWSLPADALTPAAVTRRRDLARERLPEVYAELVAATSAPSVQAITDLASSRCAFGRAAVIGDAAFVPRPHTAYGSAKAAMDVDALAAALRDHEDDVDAALAAWEPDTLALGRRVGAEGARLGARFGLGADVPAAPT